MPSPLLGSAANGTDVLRSTWTLPSLGVAGDDVLLIAFLQWRIDYSDVTSPGWTLRAVADYTPSGIVYAMFDRFHATAASPYEDTFTAPADIRWSAAQLAFRTTGVAVPTSGSQLNTYGGAGTTNPTTTAVLKDVHGTPTNATPGNVLVAYVSSTTSGTTTPDVVWPAGWTVLEDLPGEATFIGGAQVAYKIADGTESSVTAQRLGTGITSMVVLVGEYEIDTSPTPTTGVGWDVFAAAAPNGSLLETIQSDLTPLAGGTGRAIRVALNEPGSGTFKINRNSAIALESVLAKGNVVKCRFPWRSDYDFAFILETGDFTVVSGKESGGEELTFGGRGVLAYLDRGVMWDAAYTTGLDTSPTWKEIWSTNRVSDPVGVDVLNSDPTYVYVISETRRRVYKIRQSDRAIVGTSPVLFPGLASGFTGDPEHPTTIAWALEAPWVGGSSSHTKIHKIDISGAIGTWSVIASYDMGSALELTDIRADGAGYLWCSRYDGTSTIQKRAKATPATLAASYSISYGGHTQVKANGISVNGTKLAYWFEGTKRALISDTSHPTTIDSIISTHSIASFGGAWTTESAQDYFYPVSALYHETWKFQIISAVPHDPLNGIWRLDEGTPGAILWRIIQEAQASGRPQHPIPDVTYAFTQTLDSAGAAWSAADGTKEFDAKVGDSLLPTALRLIPYGLVEQMTPYLVLVGRNAASYGVNRSSATFAAGKVRFVRGVNISPEVLRRGVENVEHSDLLAGGAGGLYETAAEHDLGYTREGFISTQLKDATALTGTAVATLASERIVTEKVAIRVVIGNDETAGLYRPFTHYNVGDIVRVHTGTGEHDLDERDFTLYAITLEEGAAGTWPIAVLELGTAFLPESSTGSGGGSGTTAAGGSGGTTVVGDVDVTLEGTDDTGATLTSAVGRTIRSAAWSVYQEMSGAIRVVIAAANRLLGLDDVNADGIVDGQTLIYDAASGTFIPGASGPLVAEEDGSPSVRPGTIKVPNGGLVDNGDGTASLEYAQRLNGGREKVKAHGSVGATETVNLADGNGHTATLTTGCTFTFTGATSGELCSFALELTGAFAPTWPGSVVTADADPATGTRVWAFLSHDGGATWLGYLAGAGPTGAAGGDLVGTYPNPTVGKASASFALPGVISPAQLTANTDNWNPTGLSTAAIIRASTDASRNLTGLAGGSSGRLILLANVGAQDLVLKHDATSTAANRFYCPNDADLTVQKDTTVLLEYDATSSRWRVVGGTASSLTLGTTAANVAAVGVASSGGSAATASKSDHGHALTYHDEPLTDGASNFIFYGGDIVVVLGVPNP